MTRRCLVGGIELKAVLMGEILAVGGLVAFTLFVFVRVFSRPFPPGWLG